jgi:DNA-binding MarR family transcriptional regulator
LKNSPSVTEAILNESIANSVREISRLGRVITNSQKKKSERVGIEQYWILRLLYESGPKRIKDIAQEIGITSSPVTISVKRLALSKLVTRERGKRDERVVTVDLTDEGRKFFESWRQERSQALSSLFNILDEQERQQLYSLLQKVLKAHSRSKREIEVLTETVVPEISPSKKRGR